ncbi:MAG: sugar ABC transporter substrate-binding protein [Oscillospiraceae bacterium]|nr:sugar ABC transporter substrate-binding protein [Oscillospiraceae bacterium]
MKKTTKLVALLMALLMVITMFAACGSSAPAEEPEAPAADAPEAEAPAAEPEEGAYIGKVTLTLKHDVHGNDSIWAEKYAKEKYGATYEVIDPDQDLSKQIAGVETFISKGVDGIILHPVTEDGVNEIIQEVRDADINILCYNLNSTDKAVPFLAIDEAEVAYQMGADMAKQWMELYPDKPVSVGFISWTDIAFCFDNRTGPFIKGVKSVVEPDTSANPNPAVFQNSAGEELTGATYWEHAGGVLEVAQQVTADAITKYPDVNVVYGDNVSNGLGALAAYEAAGRGLAEDGVPLTEIIASTDASSGELIKLADPSSALKYALGMQPQTFAYAQVDMIMELINGELDNDTYVERTTPDCYFNYYKDSVQDMQDWFNTQYNPATPLDLAAEIAK